VNARSVSESLPPTEPKAIQYGPHSPFSPDERAVIEKILLRLANCPHEQASALTDTVTGQIATLESIGQALARYPSLLSEQSLGSRQRGLNTLIDTLSRSNPANFEFFLPTRALLGRSLDMAECNFYRLLRHICRQVLCVEDDGGDLRHQVDECLRLGLYTKMAEELFSGIASDEALDHAIRRKAVESLVHLWEGRLTYRVRHFFPLLEATWAARDRIQVVGGTLMGVQEIFELFQAGADPRFMDYFSTDAKSDDEIEAFREFLFATSSESLQRLHQQMRETEQTSIRLQRDEPDDRDPATRFYEFFRSRQLLAAARRITCIPGPKRTAEGYVMIYYLRKMA